MNDAQLQLLRLQAQDDQFAGFMEKHEDLFRSLAYETDAKEWNDDQCVAAQTFLTVLQAQLVLRECGAVKTQAQRTELEEQRGR